MATTKSKGPKKSEFIKTMLGQNPATNMKEINAAWKKAGHPGTISNPLYYRIKSGLHGKNSKPALHGAAASRAALEKPIRGSTKKRGGKKSEFVMQMLESNPDANLKAVNDAWKQGRRAGSISSTLLYLVKSKMKGGGSSGAASAGAGGLTMVKLGATRGRPGRPASTIVRVAPSGSKGAALERIEVEIDDMIFELKSMGGMADVEEALRGARRLLVHHHG
jgi:hypothetical protein